MGRTRARRFPVVRADRLGTDRQIDAWSVDEEQYSSTDRSFGTTRAAHTHRRRTRARHRWSLLVVARQAPARAPARRRTGESRPLQALRSDHHHVADQRGDLRSALALQKGMSAGRFERSERHAQRTKPASRTSSGCSAAKPGSGTTPSRVCPGPYRKHSSERPTHGSFRSGMISIVRAASGRPVPRSSGSGLQRVASPRGACTPPRSPDGSQRVDPDPAVGHELRPMEPDRALGRGEKQGELVGRPAAANVGGS